MKKTIFLFVAGIFVTFSAFAQTPNRENITVDKQSLSGFTVQFSDLDAKVVKAALSDFLSKSGLRAGKSAGFVYYHNQNIPKLGTSNYDIYTKVEQKGNKKSRRTILSFVVTKGNMNPLTDTGDRDVINNTIYLLEEFVPYAHAYNVEQKIAVLQKNLSKQQKELASTIKKRDKQQTAVENMTKDIFEIEEKISNTYTEINRANFLLQEYKK